MNIRSEIIQFLGEYIGDNIMNIGFNDFFKIWLQRQGNNSEINRWDILKSFCTWENLSSKWKGSLLNARGKLKISNKAIICVCVWMYSKYIKNSYNQIRKKLVKNKHNIWLEIFVEAVTDFTFLGSKVTMNSDCSHEIKRYLEGKLWQT